MFIMYDFRCPACDLKFEAMVKSNETTTSCTHCRSQAVRLISAPKALLDGVSGDFPGAALKWERQHR